MSEKNYYDIYTRTLELTNGDPDRFASLKVSKQKYAAKRRGLDWKLNDDRIIKKIAESKYCALSGRKLEFEIDNINSPSIDRIKNHLGYTPRNVQIVTTAVNRAKNMLTDDEFIKMCCDVAVNHGYVKK
jgi:hypothetical protein